MFLFDAAQSEVTMAGNHQPPEPRSMRVLRYCFPTFVTFTFWLRERLTLGGAAILVAMLICMPAIVQTEPSLVHLFSALAAMLVVTAGLSFLFRPRLQVRAKATVRCMRGDVFTIEASITNLSTWSTYELQFELFDGPQSWEICEHWPSFDMLLPGQTVRCALKIRARKRGQFVLPVLRVITTFPLHLIRRRVNFTPTGEINIYPSLAEHREINLTDFLLGTSGMEREDAQLARGSNEYLGNREYQPGVPVRRWDYASWARLGRPIVREYLDAQPATTTIIVDTCHPAASEWGEIAAVEGALSIAAKIADGLIDAGWSVETLILGSQLVQAPSQANSLSMESLLDALASVEPLPETQFGEFSELVELYTQNEATTFLIFNHWNEERRQLCASLRAIGIACRGWVITEGRSLMEDRDLEFNLRPISIKDLNTTPPPQDARPAGANA